MHMHLLTYDVTNKRHKSETNVNIVECKVCLLNSATTRLTKINSDYYCEECLNLINNPVDKNKIQSDWNKYVQKIKLNRAGKYDVLFAFSGGKDSVAALHFIVKKYGLNPLVFTVDHGFKSETVINNCINIVNLLKVDWLLTKVTDEIKEKLRNITKNGDLPCLYCNELWKADYFRNVVKLTGINVIFTGGDTLVNGNFEIPKSEWGVKSVGLPLAVQFLTEEEIYNVAYSVGWIDPKLKGWDTDCLAVGASLHKYRNQNNIYHVEELKHLSHRIRHGVLEKEDARKKLLTEMCIEPEILKLFE